jgi:Fur family ferric uptake transcriptional regulator
MKKLHSREKDQFRNLLKQEKIDNLEDRVEILAVFLETEKHVTSQELEKLLGKGKPDSRLVDDTLNLFVQYGFADVKQFDDGIKRYEHHHLGLHHDHMICTKCGKIVEFTDEKLERQQIDIAASHGFHMLLHKMEIYGICSDCIEMREEKIPLSMAKPGEKFVIHEHVGGAKLGMRLLSMGLRIGDRVEVISNSGQGQLAIAIGYTRLVIGRGVAEKIMVMRFYPNSTFEEDQDIKL